MLRRGARAITWLPGLLTQLLDAESDPGIQAPFLYDLAMGGPITNAKKKFYLDDKVAKEIFGKRYRPGYETRVSLVTPRGHRRLSRLQS